MGAELADDGDGNPNSNSQTITIIEGSWSLTLDSNQDMGISTEDSHFFVCYPRKHR
jgi:hypothetical protein